MATAPAYEHFEHQADVGVRGFGRTCEEAFEQAALALTAVVVPPETVVGRDCVRLSLAAADLDLLLIDWLDAIVFQLSAHQLIFGRFKVAITGTDLDAELYGEPLDVARHQPGVEVKAATLTALRVAELADGTWLAQCVVDV
jgi:SHS2 domain-containing protein